MTCERCHEAQPVYCFGCIVAIVGKPLAAEVAGHGPRIPWARCIVVGAAVGLVVGLIAPPLLDRLFR